uniref:Uncharacterized protein n=1 Tax=Lotharella oceanica TaxID=641309 RepID=A0A7S2TSY6_9EUKA|mmetsp:Transcript_2854/g.5446  ORF Transcript_2854/g.5446 Transcript_2854/m.5446 type:complete len:172 (+) Transcript_2854:1018-1533(+)
MNLPNKVLILAKNLNISFDYKIKTKKILAKAASYVFLASDFLSIRYNLNRFASNIPFLNEHDLYKCIKQLKKNIPNTKMKKYQNIYTEGRDTFLFFINKYLQKIVKKFPLNQNERRIATILKLLILLFKNKLNIFKDYGKFSSSKIIASTILIFIYLNGGKKQKYLFIIEI